MLVSASKTSSLLCSLRAASSGLFVHTAIGSTMKQTGEDEWGPIYRPEGVYWTEIPGQLCVEVDTAKVSN